MLAWTTHTYKFTKNLSSKRAFMTSTTACSDSAAKPKYYQGPLAGTAPYHRCYILLHSQDRPSNFPKVYQTAVSRELLLRGVRWGGGVSVNFSWMEHFSDQNSSGKSPATVFSHLGGRLDIQDVTLESLDDVERQISKHLKGPSSFTEHTSKNVDIYVCTHAARDCRCGERGQQVYESLVRTVEEERIRNPSSLAHHIRVGAVGHVGGHQYAANVLIFPHGEWLGCVKPEDVPWIVQRLIDDLKNGVHPLSPTERPFAVTHWRGRMGMTQEEMKELYSSFTGETSP